MHLSVYMIKFVDEKEIAVQSCNCNLQTVYGDIVISQIANLFNYCIKINSLITSYY